MAKENRINAIDIRIALLQSRAGRENGRIVNKLLRKRRAIAAE